VILVFCWFVSGCATGSRSGAGLGSGAEAGPVDQVYLMAMPLALNLDQAPGGDGFQVKVYAVSRNQPKPLPILEGSIEILMYDGVLQGKTESAPLKAWKYSAADLQPHAMKSLVGTGYAFTLKWEDAVPKQRKITVIARYVSSSGTGIASAPSSIAVAD